MKAKVIGLGFIILFKFYDITCIKTFSRDFYGILLPSNSDSPL